LQMLQPIGRAVYNGLQTSLKANVNNPVRGIKNLSWQVSYSLSSYIGAAKDGDFINTATDQNNPLRFIGPNALDRKNQISFGGYVDLPWSFRFGAVSHFYSPLPVSLILPTSGAGIFATDVTGDGSGDGSGVYPLGDLLPGTNIGAFGRGVSAGTLNQVIGNYNATQANTPTPAGQVLISNGILTLAQLQALQGVQPTLNLAPDGQVGLDWLKTLDLKVSWPKKVTESFTIEPSVAVFNALNFSNFDAPGNTLSGILGGGVGSVNGTTGVPGSMTDRNTAGTRVGVGSGVFALGSPRVIEFGLRLTF